MKYIAKAICFVACVVAICWCLFTGHYGGAFWFGVIAVIIIA